MSLEQPQQQPVTNDELTKVGETAAEERETTPELEQVSKFAQPFRDKAAAYAERANILFNENQKQAKAFNRKGWDKTSSLYQEWSATTKLVQTAEKLAEYYQANIGIENEIDKLNVDRKSKTKSPKETMDIGLQAINKKDELTKGAKELYAKLEQLEEKLKSLQTESSNEIQDRESLSARWEGVEKAKVEPIEKTVDKMNEEGPADDARAREKETARKEEVRKKIEEEANKKAEAERKMQIEAEEAAKKATAEVAEKARQQRQLDAEWKKRQEAKASRKIALDAAEAGRQREIAKAKLARETDAYEKKVTKGPIAWLKRLFKDEAHLDAPLDATRGDITRGDITRGDNKDDITEDELTPAQIKAKRAEENKWWNKEKRELTDKK